MARVQVPIKVADEQGNAVEGASVNIRDRATQIAAKLYTTEFSPSEAQNPASTNSDGFVSAWIERGAYNATISSTNRQTYVQPFEAAPSSDLSFDAKWLASDVKEWIWNNTNQIVPASPNEGQQHQMTVNPSAWWYDFRVPLPPNNVYATGRFPVDSRPLWSYTYDAVSARWIANGGAPLQVVSPGNVFLATGSGYSELPPYSGSPYATTTMPIFNLPPGGYMFTMDAAGIGESGNQWSGWFQMAHVSGSGTRTAIGQPFMRISRGVNVPFAFSNNTFAAIGSTFGAVSAAQANAGYLRLDYLPTTSQSQVSSGMWLWDRVQLSIIPLYMVAA